MKLAPKFWLHLTIAIAVGFLTRSSRLVANDEVDEAPARPIPVVHGVKSQPDSAVNHKKRQSRGNARRNDVVPAGHERQGTGPDTAVRPAGHLQPSEMPNEPALPGNSWTENPLDHSGDYCGEACAGECDTCEPCCGGRCWYADTDYLLWWVNGNHVPALVTTSSQGTVRANAGVLGLNTTSVLFGDETINTASRSGGRVVLGFYTDECNRAEGEWFGVERGLARFDDATTGSPILARPFFNLGTGVQDSNVVAFPAEDSGTVSVSDVSRFQGAGFRVLHFLASDCGSWGPRNTYTIAGFRYLHLGEDLSIDTTSTVTATNGALPAGTVFTVGDSFRTRNNFYGAQVGLQRETCGCCWKLITTTKLSVGGVTERVIINGSSTTTTPNGAPTTTSGGLLAQPTNIGSFDQSKFAVVPELQIKAVRNIGRSIQFSIGYDLLYWSRVARPSEQIDTRINTSQSGGGTLTGTPGPLFAFRESDLWVQGLSLGLEWRR